MLFLLEKMPILPKLVLHITAKKKKKKKKGIWKFVQLNLKLECTA